MFIMSMFYCGSFIHNLNQKVQNNPISVSLNDEPSKIDHVNYRKRRNIQKDLNASPYFQLFFPAVTFVGDFEYSFDKFNLISFVMFDQDQDTHEYYNDEMMNDNQDGLE